MGVQGVIRALERTLQGAITVINLGLPGNKGYIALTSPYNSKMEMECFSAIDNYFYDICFTKLFNWSIVCWAPENKKNKIIEHIKSKLVLLYSVANIFSAKNLCVSIIGVT